MAAYNLYRGNGSRAERIDDRRSEKPKQTWLRPVRRSAARRCLLRLLLDCPSSVIFPKSSESSKQRICSSSSFCTLCTVKAATRSC